jgi:hypothetical protein
MLGGAVVLTGLATGCVPTPPVGGPAPRQVTFVEHQSVNANYDGPSCTTDNHCVTPFTEGGTVDGDAVGSYAAAAAAVGNADNTQFGVQRTDVLSVDVPQCGTGSFVIGITEVATSAGTANGKWSVLRGFGTGELATATGFGNLVGVFDVSTGGFKNTFTGLITCTSSA